MTTPHTPQHSGNEADPASITQQEIPSIFSEFDLYLFGQGKNYRIYEKMGAHARTVDGVSGVNFAVWAPNALADSLIGDFNGRNRGAHPIYLRHNDLEASECILTGLHIDTIYK